MTREIKADEVYEVLDKLNAPRGSALADLLMPGVRGQLSRMPVDEVVKFYEPHVAKRRGPEWS